MKKIIVIIIAVVAVAAGAYGIISVQKSRESFSLESLLPAKPAFYVRVTNLSLRMDNFAKSKLFSDLKSIDYKKATAVLGAPPESFTQFETALTTAFSDDNIKFFKALFGNDVAIAVYSDDAANAKAGEKKSLDDIFSTVSIVTSISPEIAAAETVSKFFGRFNKDIKVSIERYNGKDINIIASADGTFTVGYVRFNDIMVMGVGQKAARAAIDVAAKKVEALASDSDHIKRLKVAYDQTQTFGYFNIKTFYPLLAAEIGQLAKSEQESAVYRAQLEEQLKQIQGLDALVFSSKPGDVVTFKADLLYDKNALSPDVKAYYACAAHDNQSIKFVPWDALTYQWNSCLDFTQIWKQYKEQVVSQSKAMGQEIDVNQAVSAYEQMLGLSIDRDVLPVLGREFGLYLTDINLGAIPVPKIVFFIETTGREAADALINKLLALQPALQFEEEKYSDETIRYMPIPIADGLAISTAYVGNTLLLGTSVDVLKSSLDARKDPAKSIAINAAVRANEGPKNSFFFVQVDRFLQKAGAVVDWLSQTNQQNKIQRQAFLTGSQKNLDDLHARNKELNIQIAAKQAQMTQLAAAPVDPVAGSPTQAETLAKEIDAAQKELAANQEKEKNLSEQIAMYTARAPKAEDNQEAIDATVKPLLQALQNIKYVTVTTVNSDGVLGSIVQIKFE